MQFSNYPVGADFFHYLRNRTCNATIKIYQSAFATSSGTFSSTLSPSIWAFDFFLSKKIFVIWKESWTLFSFASYIIM